MVDCYISDFTLIGARGDVGIYPKNEKCYSISEYKNAFLGAYPLYGF